MEWESKFTLGLNAVKNTDYIKKSIQIKIVQNSISYQKLSGHICLPVLGVEVGAPKIAMFDILELENYKSGLQVRAH